MVWLVLGAMAAAGLLAAARMYATADRARLRQAVRFAAGGAWAVGLAMTLAGKTALGLGLMGLGALGLGSLNLPRSRRRSTLGEGDRHRGPSGRGPDFQRDAHRRSGHAVGRAGVMTEQEAYQILGLQPGAGADEIVRAHRTLMKKLHPDQGGTTELASQVNAAKDFLTRRGGP